MIIFIAAAHEDNIWPDVELSQEEFESAYIEFSVYARRVFRNATWHYLRTFAGLC